MNISKVIVGLVASAFVASAFAAPAGMGRDAGPEVNKKAAVMKMHDGKDGKKVMVAKKSDRKGKKGRKGDHKAAVVASHKGDGDHMKAAAIRNH